MPRPATCRSASHHVFQIAFAGDEHVPRRVRDREFRFGRHHRGLRGHAARAPWLLNGAKTLSYAFNCAVHRECARRGVGDAILFTEDGYTMECPNSSIVARYGDTFVTPDPRIGILNGTSQREMFAWALEEGKKAEYRKLPIAELREADSLYMTHGGWSIPISAIDGRALAVDAAEIQAINDAIHSGRTHEDALKISPTGDYE